MEGDGALRRRYIAPREQRMRSFRESGHRHSAWIVHARAWARARRVRTTPVGFLWCAMTTIDDQFYLFFFFFSLSYFFRFSDFSSLFFLSPSLFIRAGKLLVGIAFQCVNFFTPTFVSFFMLWNIYTAISCSDYRFVLRFVRRNPFIFHESGISV